MDNTYEQQEYWVNRGSQEKIRGDLQHEQAMVNLNMEHDFMIVGQLQPTIKKDGDQWCVLYGENLQDGVAGFGETPYKAVLDFNQNWHKN